MLSRRGWTTSALALCASFALVSDATSGSAAAPCREGFAKGDWDLPSGGQNNGFLNGELFLDNSPGPISAPVYAIFATLTDVPSPCLSCITGTLDGYLDDGFGPAPDYVVRGTYAGFWFTGRGSFSAEVFTPTGVTPVGKIKGEFADPPSFSSIGGFKAEWSICP